MCCVEGIIYLVRGHTDDRVTEYNIHTNTWRCMPRLQKRTFGHSVCTLYIELGVLLTDCPCMAEDMYKIWQVYWDLGDLQ